ncbi:MAG: hypothetical protein AB1775_08595 [Bacteroidota bacterium]
MKKIFFLFLILLSFKSLEAQWELNASMGMDFKSVPSLRDYINSGFSNPGDQFASFKSAVNFSGEADYGLKPNFQIGFEYSYQIDSYNTPLGSGGVYELSYSNHRPTVMAYYVIPGPGYQFKFGGGAGYRYASLNERIVSSTNHSFSGFGLVLRALGNTMLGKNFYALVGFDLRYDVLSQNSNSNMIINRTNGENVNLNSVSVGVLLGITFTL